jgi:hypothetical protein
MRAPVSERAHFSVSTKENNVVAEQAHCDRLLSDLSRSNDRIPVVAKAKQWEVLCLIPARLTDLRLAFHSYVLKRLDLSGLFTTLRYSLEGF